MPVLETFLFSPIFSASHISALSMYESENAENAQINYLKVKPNTLILIAIFPFKLP